jgi:hypothetical protein
MLHLSARSLMGFWKWPGRREVRTMVAHEIEKCATRGAPEPVAPANNPAPADASLDARTDRIRCVIRVLSKADWMQAAEIRVPRI